MTRAPASAPEARLRARLRARLQARLQARLEARRRRGAQARRSGRAAELWATLWLMVRGWRVLGVRLRTPQAEIDILARRGRVLAVVEVKRRASLELALAAVTPDQRRRLRAAGEAIAVRRPALAGLDVRLDLIAMAPNALPVHCANAWPHDGAGMSASSGR